jgi:hypothetical protein
LTGTGEEAVQAGANLSEVGARDLIYSVGSRN